MKLWKIFVFLLMLSIISAPVFAKAKTDTPAASKNEPSNIQKVANATTDAVVDVITGEDDKSSKSLPPGLAKKDKTPPGWDKGEKTGWDKEASGTKSESPLKQFIRALFKPKTETKTQ